MIDKNRKFIHCRWKQRKKKRSVKCRKKERGETNNTNEQRKGVANTIRETSSTDRSAVPANKDDPAVLFWDTSLGSINEERETNNERGDGKRKRTRNAHKKPLGERQRHINSSTRSRRGILWLPTTPVADNDDELLTSSTEKLTVAPTLLHCHTSLKQ